MLDAFATLLEVIGLIAIAVGVALIYPPAGVIVAGVELVGVGVSLARGAQPPAAEDEPGIVT